MLFLVFYHVQLEECQNITIIFSLLHLSFFEVYLKPEKF